jgi:hypothetical protein
VVWSDYWRGFGLDTGFTNHLQVATTNNYTTFAISALYKSCCLFQPAVSSLVSAWQRFLTMVIPLLPGSGPLWTAAPLQLNYSSESELLYDWRFTANHFVLAPSPLRLTAINFSFRLNPCGYSPFVILFDERTGLSFTTAADHRQRSHSRVLVPRDSWPYFTVSDSKLPKPGGPGPRIYIPQEQGGPVIPPGIGFLFVASHLASTVLFITPLHGSSRNTVSNSTSIVASVPVA